MYMCVSVFRYVHMNVGAYEAVLNRPGAIVTGVVSCLKWVLEIELRCSARTVYAFNR